MKKLIPLLAVMAVLLLRPAFAQNVTGSVLGTLVDQTAGAVPGAECTLTNQNTGRSFTATSVIGGGFNFPSVPLGTYKLDIRAVGMKGFTMSDIVLTANEVRSLGRITLEVGAPTEVVNVTAEATPVQTSSAERSGLISGAQLNDIAIRGRDFLALLGTVPGVVDLSTGGRETVDPLSGSGSIVVLGNSSTMKNVTVDGIMSMDVGNSSGLIFQLNMDAISEVKVLTSNFQAEYGRNASTINVITKGGTRDFHGTGYTYYRHESLNANNFFNNRSGVTRPVYRYRISGYTLGGPVYIPGKFNINRDKLFFFFSQELTGNKANWGTYLSWMPTKLEKSGDFSQSYDLNGKLITIKDPTTDQPFPGNVIPSYRLNKYGKAIMGMLPDPNYTDPNPGNLYRYNYRTALTSNYPRRQEVVRADYSITNSLHFYYRFANYADEKTLPYGNWMVGNQNFALYYGIASIPGRGHSWSLSKTFSPTLVYDVTVGVNRNNVLSEPKDPAEVSRSRMAGIPQWFPDQKNLEKEPDFMPDVTFGGIPASPANMVKNAIPYRNINRNLEVINNVSKVKGRHMLKFGLLAEYIWKGDPTSNEYYGSFNFSRDTNNPFDTGHSYANALAGIFTSYSEVNDRDRADTRQWLFEWFAQDSWRVTRRLTLDFGLRMSYWTPGTEKTLKQYTMLLDQYNRNKMPALYRPAFDPTGRRVAQDPRSGAFAPAPLIGLFVPGTGDPFFGIAEGGTQGLTKSIKNLCNPGWAPRFGFAYDVFGNGNTAIRGGFGVFKDRSAINQYMSGGRNPPNFYTVSAYYGNLDTFKDTGGAIGPTSPDAQAGTYKQTSVMNFSLGIQHQFRGTVFDASYVGGLSRHLASSSTFSVNDIPMYARFDPANQDPTRPGKPLPDIFLRPYLGYGGLYTGQYAGTSNYNSLQVSANRRLSKGLQFGAAFTFSKALAYNGTNTYFPLRYWNYGPMSHDRSKVLKLNYIYDIPKIGQRIRSKALGWVTDNWSLSGMMTFMSGAPFTPGFTTTDGEDITGSALGARITVTGDPKLSKGEKTFARNFNTAVFARTPSRSFGNAGNGILCGPGLNNWDISLTKRVPLFSESRYLQFRWEMFNAFNHTQFTGLNSTARFDMTGKQIDSTFGQFTSAANPRIMQLSLRIVF